MTGTKRTIPERLTQLESEFEGFRADLAEIASGVKELRTTQTAFGRPNWQSYLLLFAFFSGLCAVGWLIVQLSISPLSAKAEVAQTERASMNTSIQRQRDDISTLQARVGTLEAKVTQQLTEVETQICAVIEVTNVQMSAAWRAIAAAWPGERPFPEAPFYFPHVGRCQQAHQQ